MCYCMCYSNYVVKLNHMRSYRIIVTLIVAVGESVLNRNANIHTLTHTHT